MEAQPFSENGVGTALETSDELRLQRNATSRRDLPRDRRAATTAASCVPSLPSRFDKSLQFAKMMSVTQGVQHAVHRVVWLPVIVDDNAGDIRQQAAALGADAIEGQQGGGSHMQPLRLAADAKTGLVHVLDRRARYEIAQRFGKAPQPFGASPTHSGDRRSGQFHAEEIGHQFGQTILGQQLIVQQIDHEGGNFRAVLHRRVDAIWKRRTRLRATGGALAIVRTMFGDDQSRWLRQIKHLTGAMADACLRIEARAAPSAGRRIMMDDFVGISDLSQRLAFVALLTTRFLARMFAQALHPRRLLEFDRSTEACRCSSYSIRAGAPVRRSALSGTHFQPSAPRSAQSALPAMAPPAT